MSKQKEEFQNLGIIFKTTRRFYGLSQTDASAILGVTQGTISKIEANLMQPELILWFRFLKAFNIKDPYCFITDIFKFDETAFKILKNEKSTLAPMVDFKNEKWICTVNDILPLYKHVAHCNVEVLKKYLLRNQINANLFRINNHPLTPSFLNSFFRFLAKINITDENITFLVPGFEKSRLYGNARSIPHEST